MRAAGEHAARPAHTVGWFAVVVFAYYYKAVLVGFAAETQNVLESARRKLAAKQVDLIVASDVSRPDAGFEVETNVATLVSAEGETSLPLQSKQQLASQILDRVEAMLA